MQKTDTLLVCYKISANKIKDVRIVDDVQK